jgi:hypothetical protein
MGFLRQLIAVSFFLIALDNYIKGEKKISVLIIIAGITFHYSAATYFMLFFINTKKYNRLFPMLILGVFTLLFSNYTLFRQVGLKIIDLPLIPYRIKWMLSAYFSLSNMTSKMGYFGLGWLAKRLIVWFVLFFRKPRTEIEILFYKIVIIGLVFETCGLTVIVLARLSYSFLMLEFIILAYIISMMRQRKNSFFFYNFGVLLLLFYLIQGPVNWFVLRNDDEARRYNPYYSVFFKPAFSERIEWQISRYNNP